MFKKFKMKTYVPLLFIGLFLFPYLVMRTAQEIVYSTIMTQHTETDYYCRGEKKQVRRCLKTVIKEKDREIMSLKEDAMQLTSLAGNRSQIFTYEY
jgi:hypothetical protein